VDRRFQLGPPLYSLSVSFNAGLVSFLAVLVVDRFLTNNEQAIGYALVWWFSLPWILIAGFIGLFTYGKYRAQKTWIRSAAIYLSTVAMAILIGVGLHVVFMAIRR